MASHIFICRLVPGDLDKLNRTKHCNPDQLNANPQIKNKGKCVADHITTDRIIDDVAFGFGRCWQNVDIFKAVSRNIRPQGRAQNLLHSGRYSQETVNWMKRMTPTSRQVMYNTKWRKLFAPTQLSIHGQWLTHR